MTRKRMIKLLMGLGASRNGAARAAALADGSLSPEVLYYDLCKEFARVICELLRQYIIEGYLTGEVAGIVGSVYE